VHFGNLVIQGTFLSKRLNKDFTFLIFFVAKRASDGIRDSGSWSDMGCQKNTTLSNQTQTVCECNHLTHFAILLSANPPTFSDPITKSLIYIGYIGFSISLVAMSLTVFTFVVFK